MRAVVYEGSGGTECTSVRTVAAPEPGPGQVRVAVAAAGLNRADILQRRGFYPAPPGAPAHIPGLEFVGRVDRNGAGADMWSPGDRVMGIVAGGAHAEFVVVHERELIAAPRALSDVEAAAVPEVFLTAWDALVLQARMARGDRVLVHAVASGVGTAALQLAKLAGASVAGTSRTAAKLDRASAEGLDHAIHCPDGFESASLKDVWEHGADVILDLVGGGYLESNIEALARGGRMVVIGLLAGLRGELDMAAVLRRRLEVRGSTLRARPLEEKIALARRFQAEVVPAFDAGALSPVVDRALAFDEVRAAHAAMESNETYGKVVLTW